ncbi:hypothetical protein [Pelagerythrobacter aerophilus]
MIRKASEQFDVRRISLDDIIGQGYEVYVEAYRRYQTHERMYSEEEFLDAIKGVAAETEWWGIYEQGGGRLVGFSENYVVQNTCFYVTIWLHPKAMANFSGYLLFFEMEQHYLGKRGLKYLSNGARNISHDTNIHEFLIQKFNYRKAYCKLNVVYTPWLRFFVHVSFPLRRVFERINLGVFAKAAILLRQEEVRRRCAGGRKW